MNCRVFACRLVLALGTVLVLSTAGLSKPDDLHLHRTQVRLRHVDYQFAVRKDGAGVPRFDAKLFGGRPPEIVERSVEGLVLENAHFRATFIPSMGRLHSFVHKPSGHEQLWVNPAAVPLPAHNDTGFWITWGGVEHVLPRGEHGTSHALEWQWAIEEDSARRKAVRAWSTEPLTGLRHTVTFSATPRSPWLVTRISVENPGARPVRFSHWTTAVLAPGGKGEVTPKTEFIVPADRFVAADKPFNQWMLPLLGPTETSPLRFTDGWKDIGDLMVTPLKKPFYAAYSHEQEEGVIRTLDLARTPGFNIWTWGHLPTPDRQREYTAKLPNRGYVEFWNGTSRDFTDASLIELGAGKRLFWVERMRAVARPELSGSIRAAVETAAAQR